MTLELAIANIYKSYKDKINDTPLEENMINEIQCAVVTNWPQIELFNDIYIFTIRVLLILVLVLVKT